MTVPNPLATRITLNISLFISGLDLYSISATWLANISGAARIKLRELRPRARSAYFVQESDRIGSRTGKIISVFRFTHRNQPKLLKIRPFTNLSRKKPTVFPFRASLNDFYKAKHTAKGSKRSRNSLKQRICGQSLILYYTIHDSHIHKKTSMTVHQGGPKYPDILVIYLSQAYFRLLHHIAKCGMIQRLKAKLKSLPAAH